MNKNDYFKVNTQIMREVFKVLIDNLKKYSSNINIYSINEELFFSIEEIKNFKEYFKFISHFAYYNEEITNLTEKEFKESDCSPYSLVNYLLD